MSKETNEDAKVDSVPEVTQDDPESIYDLSYEEMTPHQRAIVAAAKTPGIDAPEGASVDDLVKWMKTL